MLCGDAARVSRLSSNGIKLEYEEYGETTAPLAVLISGLGEQMGGVEFPHEFCAALAQRHLRVVRFDNRDVGLSTHLHDAKPGSYSYLDMADDVAGLIAGLGADSAHLVGASMGGFIARWVALRHPSLVESLTVIMSGCGVQFDSPAAEHYSKMAPHALQNMLSKTRGADNVAAAVGSYVEAWRSYNGSGFPFDENWVRECGEYTCARSYDPQGVARQVAASRSPDLLEAQEKISCNTVVIHGSEDPIFGADHARETTTRIPGAKLDIIPGMGHEMPREVWSQIVEAIDQAARDASIV
jgi:pimeloyl-ACP methyl ester carboxylesterase